jgi:hypothetical protein
MLCAQYARPVWTVVSLQGLHSVLGLYGQWRAFRGCTREFLERLNTFQLPMKILRSFL